MDANSVVFAVVEGLDIKENLGRGDRISNNIYLTNDESAKAAIVHQDLEPNIGLFEYEAVFKKNHLLAYSKLTEVEKGAEQDTVRGFLQAINVFEKISWLDRDHAIRHGNAFMLSSSGRIYTNHLDGRIWKSDGSQDAIELSRAEFRTLRKRHLDDWKAVPLGALVAVPSREKFSRLGRALYYVSGAMFSNACIDKIIYYCSALEALFATSHSELVHLLSERTAVTVSDISDERHSTYQDVRTCYKLRSAYTHGAVLRQKEIELTASMSVKLDGIVRKCMNRILNDEDIRGAMGSDDNLDAWFLKQLFS